MTLRTLALIAFAGTALAAPLDTTCITASCPDFDVVETLADIQNMEFDKFISGDYSQTFSCICQECKTEVEQLFSLGGSICAEVLSEDATYMYRRQLTNHSQLRYPNGWVGSTSNATGKEVMISTSECNPAVIYNGTPCVKTGTMHVVEYEKFSVGQGRELTTDMWTIGNPVPVCTGTIEQSRMYTSVVYEEAKLGCHITDRRLPPPYTGFAFKKYYCSATNVRVEHYTDTNCSTRIITFPGTDYTDYNASFGVCRAGCETWGGYECGLQAKQCATMSCTRTTTAVRDKRYPYFLTYTLDTAWSCTPIATNNNAIANKVGSAGAFKSQVPWFLFTVLVPLAAP